MINPQDHEALIAQANRLLGLTGNDDEMRSTAKMINFGIVYGITGFELARRLGGDMDVPAADRIIEDYKNRFPGIRDFLEACVTQAESEG